MENTKEYYQQVVDGFTFIVYPFICGTIKVSTLDELEAKAKLNIKLANDFLKHIEKLKSTHKVIK